VIWLLVSGLKKVGPTGELERRMVCKYIPLCYIDCLVSDGRIIVSDEVRN
jgi:hypothetical protein